MTSVKTMRLCHLLFSARSVPSSPAGESRKRDGEVATALTDGLMAGQSAFYAHRLGHIPNYPGRAVQLWRAAFGATALASLAGAGYHGLPPHHWPSLRAILWKCIGLATGAAGALLLVGGILASVASAWRIIWVALVLLKSIVLGVNTWQRNDFRYIIYDYGSSLLGLFVLQWWRPTPASPPIRRAMLLSFLAAVIQQKGPVLHPRFDRNALFHLVQMLALHFFDQGAAKLRDA